MHTERPPNIVFIFSDQQHWQAVGYEDAAFRTPHIDRLAGESIVFGSAFCTTPQCSPSRSSMLTGVYPHKTGVLGNIGAAGGDPLRQPTVGAWLAAAGYHTGYFGKWHLGDDPAARQGWQEHDGLHPLECPHDDSVVAANAINFVQQRQEGARPFALFVSFNDPHGIYGFERREPDPAWPNAPLPGTWHDETFANKPAVQKQFMVEDQGRVIWNKPAELWEHYRRYYRHRVELLDRNVGAVLEVLESAGLKEDSIVVFTSDHGDMDGQHRLIYKGPFMYEHMMRVPLVVRLPSCFGGQGARRIDDLNTVNVDLVPTLADCCGFACPSTDGVSLRGVLIDSTKAAGPPFVVGQYYSKQSWVNPIRMIRTRHHKYNRYAMFGEELYDLGNDPDELVNLAVDPEHQAVKAELAGSLERWIAGHADPFWSQRATCRDGSIREPT